MPCTGTAFDCGSPIPGGRTERATCVCRDIYEWLNLVTGKLVQSESDPGNSSYPHRRVRLVREDCQWTCPPGSTGPVRSTGTGGSSSGGSDRGTATAVSTQARSSQSSESKSSRLCSGANCCDRATTVWNGVKCVAKSSRSTGASPPYARASGPPTPTMARSARMMT